MHVVSKDDSPRPDDHDWQRVAPRWLLLLALFLTSGAVGWLVSKLDAATSKEQLRVDQALSDAPTKYQARLGERMASLEAEMRVLSKAVDALAKTEEEHSKVEAALTAELRLRR
jgi:hypothetical protein